MTSTFQYQPIYPFTFSSIGFSTWWGMWKTHVFRKALGPRLQQIDPEYAIPEEEVLILCIHPFKSSLPFSWSRLGGQLLQRFVFAWKPTEVSLAEQTLSLSSLVVILCRKVHQEQLEISEMFPHYWSWVLDHLVAADRMSRFSQGKGIEDLGGIKCRNSVPLPRGLRIQDRFAAVEDLELS